MAEPIPVYPQGEPKQLEPKPETGSQVVSFSPGMRAPSWNRESFFDRVSFQAGRSLLHMRETALTAWDGISRAATYMAEERPIHLVAGVAVAAFAAGSGLRIWRSHHE
jgi:hypothetical protein